jgi:hypothetical protein
MAVLAKKDMEHTNMGHTMDGFLNAAVGDDHKISAPIDDRKVSAP